MSRYAPSISASPGPRAISATPGPSSITKSSGSTSPSSHLLPFAKSIIRSIVPQNDEPLDEGDALIILAKGLGMRAIVAATLKLYDAASNLVIIVNARPEEQAGLSQELTRLGVRSPGLQALDSSLNENKRKAIYARGGLISVTTRILIVDMLKKTIPLELVSGLVILHAEDVTPLSNEAFAVRMYREANRDGFLKAFSDNADSFAIGLNPLQTVMGQLRIRKVELWPRFHKSIIRDLGERKADVVELHQPLSRSMRNIQNALVECLDATLNELKRSASGVEVDDYSLENAIFKAFDVIVRRQLAKKWHLLSPKTRQLVDDLKTLRELLDYLISYDCVSFVQYLDFLLASQTTSSSGKTRQNQSPWLFMDAANIVFAEAKARVMVGAVSKEAPTTAAKVDAPIEVNDSDEEEAAYGQLSRPSRSSTKRPWWLPAGIEPTLEEPPKWQLLREVLDEIEQDIHWTEDKDPSLITPNNTILIMTSTSKSCESVQRYLSEMTDSIIGAPDDVVDEEGHADPSSTPGRRTMMTSLKRYLYDKMSLANMTATMKGTSAAAAEGGEGNEQSPQKASTSSTSQPYESEALKRKQVWERGAAPPTKRRRQRGGANMSVGQRGDGSSLASEQLEKEAAELSEFINRAQALADEGGDGEDEEVGDASIDQDDSLDGSDDEGFVVTGENIPDVLNTDDFDEHFGVLDMDSLIVVRHYNGDGDDYILQELRPRFVILFDPDPAFVRRIELFRATTPGVNPRVYFLLYAESVEEQRYLSSLRREKESFEKLIREKSMMALPLQADGLPAAQDADERLLRTINSRIAGGQRGVTNEKPRIIVDMREFQSSLPSLLSAAGMEVHPHTLPVADYVISPEQAVERKSLSDLISSFNSGRLFSQMELLSAHYAHPILLIEFGEGQSFSLMSLKDSKSNPKQVTSKTRSDEIDVQAKLVMLSLAFPRMKIIWSMSPYATADIFVELKSTYDEPDVAKVVGTGADGGTTDTGAEGGEYSLTLQEMLRCIPGVSSKNVRYLMSSVKNLEELCDLDLKDLQDLIGNEPGKQVFEFLSKRINKGSSRRGGGARTAAWKGNSGRRYRRV